MEVDCEVAILLELKQTYKKLTGGDVPSSGGKKEKKKEGMKVDTKTGIKLKLYIHFCTCRLLYHHAETCEIKINSYKLMNALTMQN